MVRALTGRASVMCGARRKIATLSKDTDHWSTGTASMQSGANIQSGYSAGLYSLLLGSLDAARVNHP